jgi:hypothetical protein
LQCIIVFSFGHSLLSPRDVVTLHLDKLAQQRILAESTIDQRKLSNGGREEMTLDFLDETQVEYEEALLQTHFGKFHYSILAICGLIYLNTAVGITIISFVLPSATCGECLFNLPRL